jgi:hypothetical protein
MLLLHQVLLLPLELPWPQLATQALQRLPYGQMWVKQQLQAKKGLHYWRLLLLLLLLQALLRPLLLLPLLLDLLQLQLLPPLLPALPRLQLLLPLLLALLQLQLVEQAVC